MVKEIRLLFKAENSEVEELFFETEDMARDFAHDHPESCVIIDRRISKQPSSFQGYGGQGGENAG